MEFCESLHTITCDIPTPDWKNTKLVAQHTVSRMSGVGSFTVYQIALSSKLDSKRSSVVYQWRL